MQTIGELSFEAALTQLEETVQQLEAEELSLEKSLALFERGEALAAHCQVQLDSAELKVQQLLPSPQGDYHAVPLDVQES